MSCEHDEVFCASDAAVLLAAIFQEVSDSQCLCLWQLPAESQVNNNATQNSLTEEQRAEAETLKTDGKKRRRKLFFTASSDVRDVYTCLCVSEDAAVVFGFSSQLMCFLSRQETTK